MSKIFQNNFSIYTLYEILPFIMKKLVLFISLLSFSFYGSAQVGIRVGTAIPSINSEIGDLPVSIGFYAGIFKNIQISDSFSIRPEVNYVMADIAGNDNQIQVPILISLFSDETFEVLIGPFGSYFLSTSDYKSLNYGFTGAISYTLGNFLLEGRYNLGLAKMSDQGLFLEDGNTKINGLQLGISFKI